MAIAGIAYNVDAYNTQAYNLGSLTVALAPTSLLTFDGFNCDDRSYMTIQDLEFSSGNEVEIDQFNIPRSRGIKVSSLQQRGKILTAHGVLDVKAVLGLTVNELEGYIDTIKKSLRGVSKILVTNYGGKQRVYTATLMNMGKIFKDRKRYHTTYTPFTLEFLCEDTASDWDYTQYTAQITNAVDTISATGSGTIEGKPIIVIVFSAATGVTSMTVQIDENGQKIVYSGALAAGDVLVFDSENQTVKLNGNTVDFSGYFPLMALDGNTFRFTTDGSARTFRATILTKNSYL